MLKLRHKATGEIRKIGGWQVFWVFCFGPFYFLFLGFYKWALYHCLLALFTGGIFAVLSPFFARDMLRKAYLEEDWEVVSFQSVQPGKRLYTPL